VYKTDPAGYYSSFKVGLLIICKFIIKRSLYVVVKNFPGNMHVHVHRCIYCITGTVSFSTTTKGS
jgi:hypothetical protein